jgi:Ca2+-binding EF-hand superfamily protein
VKIEEATVLSLMMETRLNQQKLRALKPMFLTEDVAGKGELDLDEFAAMFRRNINCWDMQTEKSILEYLEEPEKIVKYSRFV